MLWSPHQEDCQSVLSQLLWCSIWLRITIWSPQQEDCHCQTLTSLLLLRSPLVCTTPSQDLTWSGSPTLLWSGFGEPDANLLLLLWGDLLCFIVPFIHPSPPPTLAKLFNCYSEQGLFYRNIPNNYLKWLLEQLKIPTPPPWQSF